ncbi:MAG: DUF4145 domain-containing protein [Candidatus Paceibacterota bacterium]
MIEKELKVGDNLELPKCPHCAVVNPNLIRVSKIETKDHFGANRRHWSIYKCSKCGGVTSAYHYNNSNKIEEFFPKLMILDKSLPNKAFKYLQQAHESVNTPSGCIMLCASAVDEMLKQREYFEGSLYNRIKKATEDNVLTKDMEQWAHDIRLDANDERHSDYDASMASIEDAKRALSFTDALAEYLFILPNKVKRGLNKKEEN